MDTKEIKIDFEYDPNEVEELVKSFYDRFDSKENVENKKYAILKLKDYKFYNRKTKLPEGRYVRWIMTKDTKNMRLSSGGFIANDDQYSVWIITNSKKLKISKKNAIFFVKLNKSEKIMAAIMR